MAEPSLTPNEYETWLTPREAIDSLLPAKFDAATRMIVENCRLGLLKAASRRIVYFEQGERRELNYQVLVANHWNDFTYDDLLGDHFWDSGNANTYDPGLETYKLSGLGPRQRDPVMVAARVRFDPVGIQEMAPRLSRAAEPTPPPAPLSVPAVQGRGTTPAPEFIARELVKWLEKSKSATVAQVSQPRISPSGKITAAEFDAWYDVQLSALKNRGYRPVWAAALEHFKPRKVSKKLAESKSFGRAVGRKQGI